jgi:hypothetical protein
VFEAAFKSGLAKKSHSGITAFVGKSLEESGRKNRHFRDIQ